MKKTGSATKRTPSALSRTITSKGNRLLDELHVLGAHLRDHPGCAGQVRARPREARDDSARERIAHRHEDNRNRLRGMLGRQRGLRRERYDNVDLKAHEVGRQFGQLIELAFRPAKLEGDVLALDVAEVLQALTHGLECRRRIWPQHPNARNFFALLRARGARPRHRGAAEERDERAALDLSRCHRLPRAGERIAVPQAYANRPAAATAARADAQGQSRRMEYACARGASP